MQFDLNDLPSDTALLHSLVRDMASAVEHRDDEIERLQLIIKQLQRARFGRRSERIDAEQLGRKNHLFAGSDIGGQRWATLSSIIETAKMNDVEPYAYLHDVLQRMVDGHPVNRLSELLPWNWRPAEPVKS